MLPTNFEALAGENPDLKVVVREIADWCESHATLSAIDPRRIARDIDAEPNEIVAALTLLVKSGVLKQVYRFETPAGYLLSDDYESYLDVPSRLRDRYDQPVSRSEGTIVPVFRGTK